MSWWLLARSSRTLPLLVVLSALLLSIRRYVVVCVLCLSVCVCVCVVVVAAFIVVCATSDRGTLRSKCISRARRFSSALIRGDLVNIVFLTFVAILARGDWVEGVSWAPELLQSIQDLRRGACVRCLRQASMVVEHIRSLG